MTVIVPLISCLVASVVFFVLFAFSFASQRYSPESREGEVVVDVEPGRSHLPGESNGSDGERAREDGVPLLSGFVSFCFVDVVDRSLFFTTLIAYFAVFFVSFLVFVCCCD